MKPFRDILANKHIGVGRHRLQVGTLCFGEPGKANLQSFFVATGFA
jgi:hypothetical protein